jgi:4-hydroxybenzoate polyprenyltransferase
MSTELDVTILPYEPLVLELIREERAKGRQIVLATASHKVYAERVALHLGLFDKVLATEADRNLSAVAKRDALVGEFGEKGFDYAGNSRDDLPVWHAARRAYVVSPGLGVEKQAKALGNVERVIAPAAASWTAWMRAFRFHQWLKNLLLFVPLLASHKVTQMGLVVDGLIAFVLFGLCASSVYILNDLLDLADDRHHPAKRLRPFASGQLPVKSGLVVFPLLLCSSIAGSMWLLPWQFTLSMLTYYALTLAYSLALKRMIILDVVVLASLYTIRIIAGTFAFAVSATFWMLAFSMFIFLSLALVKRYAELRVARDAGRSERSRGRGYFPDDLEMLAALGGAAGYMSVMVLALYIQDINTVALYHHPKVIWLACPLLLFWVSRIWLLTHRGQMHDDPVVFAIKDRVSLVVGALFGAIFWLAA